LDDDDVSFAWELTMCVSCHVALCILFSQVDLFTYMIISFGSEDHILEQMGQ